MDDAGTPLVLHPWELDEGQPQLPGGTLGHRFAHRAGLQGNGSHLRDLLAGISLTSLEPGWRTDEGRPLILLAPSEDKASGGTRGGSRNTPAQSWVRERLVALAKRGTPRPSGRPSR